MTTHPTRTNAPDIQFTTTGPFDIPGLSREEAEQRVCLPNLYDGPAHTFQPDAGEPVAEDNILLAERALTPHSADAGPQDTAFRQLVTAVQEAFARNFALYGPHLFTTDANIPTTLIADAVDAEMLGADIVHNPYAEGGTLFRLYIKAFASAEERQGHNCRACMRFFNQVGGLVFINPTTGEPIPAFWDVPEPPALYAQGICDLYRHVHAATVTGAYHTMDPVLGTPESNGHSHLHVVLPAGALSTERPTPFANDATSAAKHACLTTALELFTRDDCHVALSLLAVDALPGADKLMPPITWLDNALRRLAIIKHTDYRHNLIWLLARSAVVGQYNIHNTVAGTLLEDIQLNREDLDGVKARLAHKLKPENLMRPQAGPTEGQLAAAERIVAQLGLAPALARRIARLDEVEAVWTPKPPEPTPPGVFGHLRATQAPPTTTLAEPRVMSWVVFSRDVLPQAERMRFWVPPEKLNYVGLTTAVDPEAPPLLKWDRPERRQPVAAFTSVGGSAAQAWGLTPGTWAEVAAIALHPRQWVHPPAPASQEPLILLTGMRVIPGVGSCLFPDIVRGELYPVRAVIEAHSNTTPLEVAGVDTPACGVGVPTVTTNHRGEPVLVGARLHVTLAAGVTITVVLDRLE